MVASHVGSTEAKLFAKFLYECAFHDAFQQAYYPIVGVGKNAATLHYNKNNAPLTNSNDLVLVDAGCEVDCYASDITRCFPVGGKFSPEARTIYTIVLDMQKVKLRKIWLIFLGKVIIKKEHRIPRVKPLTFFF